MPEELKTMQQALKTTQETTKTTNKLEFSDKEDSFLKKIFGEEKEDLTAIFSDKFKFYQKDRFSLLKEKTEKRLKQKGIKFTIPVSPELAIPLIEAALTRDNYIWANMLSNALDPDFKNKITPNFVSILHNMVLNDVMILDAIYSFPLSIKILNNSLLGSSIAIARLKIDTKECHIWFLPNHNKEVNSSDCNGSLMIARLNQIDKKEFDMSLKNLARFGCLKPREILSETIRLGGNNYENIELIRTTEFGAELCQSIK